MNIGSNRPSHASTDFAEQASESQGIDMLGTSQNASMDENVLGWFKKRNGETLKGALAFVPWVLQQSYFEGGLDQGQIVIHRGLGAVVFSDASGFTSLTERLASKNNGAEMLSTCLKMFFTPLIDLINAYRGDVIKFSGDALTVYFMAVDDTKGAKYNFVVPPHGTYGLPDLGPAATAILRASACCIEIHKRLHMFDTGVDDVRLCLHIGVGYGQVNILQVGGVVPPETHVPRCEYLIAGPPLEQIAIAEPLAKNGQTCLSTEAWDFVKDCVIEGTPLEDRPDFHLLQRMDEAKYTFPTIKHAARENDDRKSTRFRLSELNVIRRYIPSAVFKQIECGTLDYVNEMRNVSVIFISGSGLDVMNDKGAKIAQDLMAEVQTSCYAHEGTLNKFLYDDKGMLFLIVFGLPPLVHTDDPTRAVLACFDMVKVFKKLNLVGRFGVTSGRSYCGVCGSASRMEYTVLGDCVNLSARLMFKAPQLGIYCDEETKNKSTQEIVFNALTPINVKGKKSTINIFQPVLKEPATQIGLTRDKKIRFPWYDNSLGGAAGNDSGSNVTKLCSVKGWDAMTQASALLGSGFQKAIHSKDTVIEPGKPNFKPAEGTPFHEGGVIVIEGKTGMGQQEVAEHIIMHAAVNFKMMPVFGTMGPRPGDSSRLAVELLRSSLGVFRHLDPDLGDDEGQMLPRCVPPEFASMCPILSSALNDHASKEKSGDILDTALDVVIALVQKLLQQTPILMCLQFEYGTSLFPKTLQDQNIFWKSIEQLTKISDNNKMLDNSPRHPFVMVVISQNADRGCSVVQHATEAKTLLHLEGLSESSILEYVSNLLGIQEAFVPHPLRTFVGKVTLGNPHFIKETLEQLIENQFISVILGTNGQAKNIENMKDLNTVNLSSWGSTRMVGGTKNLLESLDPLEAAVLKMSTCFLGSFTLPDLAASTCSRWAGATHFDLLRLFKALRKLVAQSIVEVVEATDDDTCQRFQCNNILIRDVGGSMVLEQQKKSVKRQALIDRTLNRELPSRMEVVQAKKSVHHIPWYYEQAFKRMM